MFLPMNRLPALFLMLLGCVVSACAPNPEQYTELESRTVDAVGVQSVLIQVDYGEVIILGSEDSRVTVDGLVLFVDELEYVIDSMEAQILIKAFAHKDNPSRVPLKVIIQLPQPMQVKVETEAASVLSQDFQGDLEVASTSGDITVERLKGGITLRSNRGDITVRESSGDVSVVGNYGALTIQNVRGETAVSTIMGNVLFDGLIQIGDSVRLETDHGAVSVHLKDDSALGVQVRSTSGDVACILPGLASTTRTCDGDLHSGGGSLSIRTVSGGVTLQLIP
jgi:hypothetical protein